MRVHSGATVLMAAALFWFLVGCDNGGGGASDDVLDSAQTHDIASDAPADTVSADLNTDTGVDTLAEVDTIDTADLDVNAEVDVEAFFCDLGTMYPNSAVIDPDNPDFEDAQHSRAQVIQTFADAKTADNQAYQAYRAARDYADLLTCPFCACGCADSIGHLSAIDCFKDMHGFT